MDEGTAAEYLRLCARIEAAQQEAEAHDRQRQLLADCVALLILQSLDEHAGQVQEAAGWRGTCQASLMTWLQGAGYRPDPLLFECTSDILAALGRRVKPEGGE